MDLPSTSAAAMKEEIARLTGAINRQKIHTPDYNPRQTTFYPGGRPRNNVYVNPDYKPPLRAAAPIPPAPRPPIPRPLSTYPDEKRDVVINGIAFETSGRSLVRKDLLAAVNMLINHARGSIPQVGRREGVCRDFAVLGYCEKGLDCEHQHVRECPDFAEKGICTTKKCKLPHVIRANHNRPKTAIETISRPFGKHVGTPQASNPASASSSEADVDSSTSTRSRVVTAEDAQMGDEFISLTFHESESDDDDDESDEEEAEDEESEQAQDEMM
ncbi:hypothetical protein PHLCEN_2v4862 [Hermanssonia centrifuga]|uniref:C3H1-type domain-containing protein n=1 Tax=Hermanssonia centrifuga TaxID=98765 RepID=A0A2R6PG19_9APHY|nr:hypothetical protein PHLCEN_2v4862 [Hermanssonia centrifuga]